MRIRSIVAGLSLAVLGGCAHDPVGERSYAGSPGSTYDAADNPPMAHGAATYNASSPVVPHDYGNSGAGAATR